MTGQSPTRRRGGNAARKQQVADSSSVDETSWTRPYPCQRRPATFLMLLIRRFLGAGNHRMIVLLLIGLLCVTLIGVVLGPTNVLEDRHLLDEVKLSRWLRIPGGTSSRRGPRLDVTFAPPVAIGAIPRGVSGNAVFREAGYEAKPRSIGHYFSPTVKGTFSKVLGTERLDPNMQRRLLHVDLGLTERDILHQINLGDSEDYADGWRDELEDETCEAQYEWQKTSFPTCNHLHEMDLTDLRASKGREDAQTWLLGNGYWRDVWLVKDPSGRKHALKTIRYEHDYEDRNYDRHRRDAVAMERLTGSPNILDIYGFCGNSGIFEYADGGDIEDMVWYAENKWNSTERLLVAYQVAAALSDTHNWFKDGVPAIAHTDITTSQYVYVDGQYKLNDFNRCRFIAKDRQTGELCGFYVGNNPGHFRSPEEYAYEAETEKIDVYSMGNIFYVILTAKWPFQDNDNAGGDKNEHKRKKNKHNKPASRVKRGERPEIPEGVLHSEDLADKAVLRAIQMCWVQDPVSRASSKQVFEYLGNEIEKMGIKLDEDENARGKVNDR